MSAWTSEKNSMSTSWKKAAFFLEAPLYRWLERSSNDIGVNVNWKLLLFLFIHNTDVTKDNIIKITLLQSFSSTGFPLLALFLYFFLLPHQLFFSYPQSTHVPSNLSGILCWQITSIRIIRCSFFSERTYLRLKITSDSLQCLKST